MKAGQFVFYITRAVIVTPPLQNRKTFCRHTDALFHIQRSAYKLMLSRVC